MFVNVMLRCLIILNGLLFLHPAVVHARVLDSIAAIVNNQAITCYQVRQAAKDLAQQLKKSGMQRLPSSKALMDRVLDTKITKTLELPTARRLSRH